MSVVETREMPVAVAAEVSKVRPEVFLMTNTLETGGGERQFSTLAGGLAGGSMSIRLGCLRKSGMFAGGLEDMAEFRPGGSLLGWRSQRTRLALRQHLLSIGAAVAHSFDFYTNLMLIPAARSAGVPVVIGSHRQLGDLMSRPRFWAQRAMFQLCDRVVCNSQAAADYLREQGKLAARKLVVISNGLPEEAFAEVTPMLPRVAGRFRVGMIARMNDPAKGHEAFLRIAAKLAALRSDVELVLVGDGPLRAGLEESARAAGLGARVLFLGERRDIPAVLASLDVSVLTSISESASNVIMESMAGGLPMVAARVGGNSELVRDGATGFLAPNGDEDALTSALGRLLDSSELREKFGRNAKREAQSRFALREICHQYEELYKSVLAEKGWHPAMRSGEI